MARKADINSKTGKYLMAVKAGKLKKEAAVIAGFSERTQTAQIEASDTFKDLEKIYFKDELLKQTSMSKIAMELLKNIEQDADRGAKNTAIKLALERLEPETNPHNEDDKVLVILKQ